MEKFTIEQLAFRFSFPKDVTRQILMRAGVEPIDDNGKEIWLSNAVETLRETDRSKISFRMGGREEQRIAGTHTARTVAAPQGITCRLPSCEVDL